jgi:hypothetical protein
MGLADEPLLGVPGSAAAPAGDTFDAAALADILVAKGRELRLRA